MTEAYESDEAVQASREAAAKAPHEDRPRILSNLGRALYARYQQAGKRTDLEEAIHVQEEVLRLTSHDSRDRHKFLWDLSNSLYARYQQAGNEADLERAIQAQEEALSLTSPDSRDRPDMLTALGGVLYARFQRTGDSADLERAIQVQREGLELTPRDSPTRATPLYNLAVMLESRWRVSHDVADERQARLLYQQAIDSGHPAVAPQAMFNLGTLLAQQGDVTGATRAYQDAIHSGHARVASEAEVELAKLTGEKSPEPATKRAEKHVEADRQEETAPTLTDNPAVIDELDRESLAKVLAARIRSMRRQEIKAAGQDGKFPRGRSFLLHIQGPWGAGKTSLLNFLRKELNDPQPTPDDPKPTPWVVVTFNAWQHQRIAPPWWWLMSTVYQQGFHELWRIGRRRDAWLFRLREWVWRLRGGWPGYAMTLLALLLLVVIWRTRIFASLASPKASLYETVKTIAVGVVAILVPILTIWGTVRSASRWLLTKSARSARTFIENTRDPMQIVKDHFVELANWAYPLAILIDDLDRCKGSYVVELLEGIQTLFRDVPVTYIVAADRDWLADSYKAEYDTFVSSTGVSGRPLGYLFLEKTFQLSAIVPALSKETQTDYWTRLIDRQPPIDREELERERKKAAGKFTNTKTEEEIWDIYAKNPGSTKAQQRATVEAMAIQLSTPRFHRQTEHALQPFAPLLDANPRAMKRLVNAYGIVRDIETLNKHSLGDRSAQQRTALWVVLQLRWPKLADHLKRHPEHLEGLKGGVRPANVPADLEELFGDQEVKRVVLGEAEDVEVQLDSDYIKNHAI